MIDDFNRYTWLMFLFNFFHIFDRFVTFKKLMEIEFHYKIKTPMTHLREVKFYIGVKFESFYDLNMELAIESHN